MRWKGEHLPAFHRIFFCKGNLHLEFVFLLGFRQKIARIYRLLQ